MMKTRRSWCCIALTALLLVSAPALGQTAGDDEIDPESSTELHAAMQEYFQKRLRSELALSDEQIEHILPRVRSMEQAKRAAQRTRMQSVRKLRRGFQQGATDEELQGELDRLEQSQIEQQRLEREMLREIDQVLSTRQRVQLRFFTQRFRRDMQDKVRELRGDRPRGRDGARAPRRQRP